jgi:hypothetical protein
MKILRFEELIKEIQVLKAEKKKNNSLPWVF